MRKLFGLPAKELKLSDRIIFVRFSNRVISFIADQVLDVTTKTKQKVITADNIFPGLEVVKKARELEKKAKAEAKEKTTTRNS